MLILWEGNIFKMRDEIIFKYGFFFFTKGKILEGMRWPRYIDKHIRKWLNSLKVISPLEEYQPIERKPVFLFQI